MGRKVIRVIDVRFENRSGCLTNDMKSVATIYVDAETPRWVYYMPANLTFQHWELTNEDLG